MDDLITLCGFLGDAQDAVELFVEIAQDQPFPYERILDNYQAATASGSVSTVGMAVGAAQGAKHKAKRWTNERRSYSDEGDNSWGNENPGIGAFDSLSSNRGKSLSREFSKRGGVEITDCSRRTEPHFRCSRGESPEPSDIFDELIQDNPEVCSNCFIITRNIWLPSVTEGARGGSWRDLVQFYKGKRNRIRTVETEEESDQPGVCANCGEIQWESERPLSKDQAKKYAWNLSKTLAEFDVGHNPLVLAFVVTHLKRCPEFSGGDQGNFRAGIRCALDSTSYSIGDVLLPGTRPVLPGPGNADAG